jgi:hypothetical protein
MYTKHILNYSTHTELMLCRCRFSFNIQEKSDHNYDKFTIDPTTSRIPTPSICTH